MVIYGINLFTEDRHVCTRGPGLVCNPGTPGDVIRVYRKMTGNFKCGMNNMLSRSIDPVDRRYLQWRADDGHRSLRHVSVPDKPIRERGRFECANTPVRDADWLVDYLVGPIPVGEIRINIRDPADRGQSPDAAPSTSAFTIDISAGKPTLGTEVQLPRYTVSEEATVGENWAPDCAPAVLAQVLGESRANQTWSSS